MRVISDDEEQQIVKAADAFWAIYKSFMKDTGLDKNDKWDYKTKYTVEVDTALLGTMRRKCKGLYDIVRDLKQP